MTAVLILAAGSSRRLGRPKQLARLEGETLLERAVRVANVAGIGPVLVVGDAEDAAVVVEARRLRCEVVLNREAAEGMASSLRAGLRALGESAGGVVVMTCDQPAVTAEHLRALAGEAAGGVIASQYAGRRGVPAYFPAAVFGELMELRGDAGARDLLREAPALRLEGGEIDVDTADDLERAAEVFGRRAG